MTHNWNDTLNNSIKTLPVNTIDLRTIQSSAIVSKTDISIARIDNGPLVTKDGVRRGRNDIAHVNHRFASHNPANRHGMVSSSKILLDRASTKKANALAVPEQVGAMLRKSRELEASIARKLSKGHDASNLVKCLSVLQARVRFMLGHCEEHGLLEIKPLDAKRVQGTLITF